MKKTMLRAMRYGVILLLAMALAAIHSLAFAADTHTVLRVAFPQVNGFSTTNENGERVGLVVDYLNEISKYTGWEYQYIDTDGESMIDGFLAGEYDLMGGTYYSRDLEKYFAYPNYSTGHAKSVLLARWDDTRISGYNISDLNGMTIGVHERAAENIRRLKEFLSMNDLDCTIRLYKVDQLINGNMYDYLENGEIDLLLGNAGDDMNKFRTVASFDSQPHYIVTTKDNQEVWSKLNWAMEQILESNPNFAEERYAANFSNNGGPTVSLNNEELAYVKEKGTVTVAIPRSYHPFICINTPERIHDGIVPDILSRVSEFSGLEFEYFYVDTYAESLEAVSQGKADLAGFYLGSEAEAAQDGLSLTQSYVTLNDLVVRNKAVSYPAEGMSCAMLKGRQLPANISAAKVTYYGSVYDMLAAVNRGEADFAYGLSAIIEQELQQHYMGNTVPATLFNSTNDISFALSRPAEARLLTILNKTISNLTDTEQAAIANQNLISSGTVSMSLGDLLHANPGLVVIVIVSILLLIIAIIVIEYHSRMKTVIMSSELKRAESDSKAKSAFLSRMSHEIRTPMNAIVGLTDLTNMQEGVPKAVQVNLSKLRSSSQYLLGLINDILDMSRIDSGMMTIVNEPFSMIRMLDELQSMMKAEAERQGLNLVIEANVKHTALTGDSIRLRQVLTNLLSNALKFTPPGGKVELRALETDANEAHATFLFQVIDNGAGIPEEDQERIFDAFEQVGPNLSRSQGTGLGLPISSNIVHLMGGKLKLKSEVDQGSEFSFSITLPYGTPTAESAAPVRADLLANAQILLAEDNDLNAEIAMELLGLQGAHVTRASNGKQAVDLFAASAPGTFQVILMDIQMPIMNGLEATRAIRSLEHSQAAIIPIVAMTANSFQADVEAAIAAGMNGFITKPPDINYMYDLLCKLLQGNDAEPKKS